MRTRRGEGEGDGKKGLRNRETRNERKVAGKVQKKKQGKSKKKQCKVKGYKL